MFISCQELPVADRSLEHSAQDRWEVLAGRINGPLLHVAYCDLAACGVADEDQAGAAAVLPQVQCEKTKLSSVSVEVGDAISTV